MTTKIIKKLKIIAATVFVLGLAINVYMMLNAPFENVSSLVLAQRTDEIKGYKVAYKRELTETINEYIKVPHTNGTLCLILELKIKRVECKGKGTINCMPSVRERLVGTSYGECPNYIKN